MWKQRRRRAHAKFRERLLRDGPKTSTHRICWRWRRYILRGDCATHKGSHPWESRRGLSRLSLLLSECTRKNCFRECFQLQPVLFYFLSLHFRSNCDAWRPQAEDWLEATPMQVHHARHVQLMAIGWHMQMTKVSKFVLYFLFFWNSNAPRCSLKSLTCVSGLKTWEQRHIVFLSNPIPLSENQWQQWGLQSVEIIFSLKVWV